MSGDITEIPIPEGAETEENLGPVAQELLQDPAVEVDITVEEVVAAAATTIFDIEIVGTVIEEESNREEESVSDQEEGPEELLGEEVEAQPKSSASLVHAAAVKKAKLTSRGGRVIKPNQMMGGPKPGKYSKRK